MSNTDSSIITTTPYNTIHPISEASQTPKVTPPNAPTMIAKTKRGRPPAPTTARRKIESPPEPSFQPQIDDDEYAKFVESLNLDNVLLGDDDEEFKLTENEDSDDDDDDDDDGEDDEDSDQATDAAEPYLNGKVKDLTAPSPLPDIGTEFYSELEAELGSLLEEDLEAAVTTLLGTSQQHINPTPSKVKDLLKGSPATPATASPRTPLKEAARAKQTVITEAQKDQLSALMKQHYQLLIQQAVLSVRAAHGHKYSKPKTTNDMYCTETQEDLAEILDGAIGMLQDLDQNRKDAIRTSLQLVGHHVSKRSLLPALESEGERRLTRAAFTKTLQTGHKANSSTCFDVKGLCHLNATFSTLDKSSGTEKNILDLEEHGDACKLLLEIAGADILEAAIPGYVDVSTVLSDPKEFFGPEFKSPCTTSQNVALRRDRIQFTSAEDNLVLRGVNLYGEKQWMLIADRYLPDRSINVIAQRYSKLSILLFRAHGINIDSEGNLEAPPKHEGVERADPKKVEALKKVAPPAILNVHRWSIEEDLTLLRAVPVMGHMWSELSARLMPHRDRGHLRKRYQVLERRIKATINRAQREDGAGSKPAKPPKALAQRPVPPRPVPNSLPPVVMDHPNRWVPSKQLITSVVPSAKKRNSAPFPHHGPPSWHSTTHGPSPAHLVQQPVNGAYADRIPVPNVLPKPSRRKPGYTLPVRSPNGATQSMTDEGPGLQIVTLDQHDNNTRLGFEQILNEASNEWSQMSRVKEMMEKDTASMIATTIVNNLAKGMPHSEASALSASEWDQKNDSILAPSEGEQSKAFASPMKRPRGALMLSVMERSQKKGKTDDDEDLSSNHYYGNEKKESAEDETMNLPVTPSKGAPGTPLGFSRMSFSPAMKSGFSPSSAALRFSPGTNSLLLTGNNGASMDGFEYCNFEISESSEHAFGDGKGGGTPLKSFPTMPPPTLGQPLTPSRALFHDANSLLASDFDAITALNSMSNSPARSLLRRPASQIRRAEEKPNHIKKSLFARVVGGVEDKRNKSAGSLSK